MFAKRKHGGGDRETQSYCAPLGAQLESSGSGAASETCKIHDVAD